MCIRSHLSFAQVLTKSRSIGALSGSFIVDKFGRRRILLTSTTAITVILILVSGLLSSQGNTARANAGVTFIYLFMVIFSFGWTPM
jgi:nitrate/nitrite transporter NarK